MADRTEPIYCGCCGVMWRTTLTKKHVESGLTDVEARILIDELRKQIGVCQASLKRLSKKPPRDTEMDALSGGIE